MVRAHRHGTFLNVAQSRDLPLIHGELPCPACGYLRRGLALDRPCSECGARGFDGELIVSGLPGVEPETRRSGSILSILQLIVAFGLFLPMLFGASLAEPWRRGLTNVALAVLALAGVYFVVGVMRRRLERSANLSLGRVSIEFRASSIVVRQRSDEWAIPLTSIRSIDTQLDSPTKKTRVWIAARDGFLPTRGSDPTIVLVGDLDSQRLVKAEMERRVRSV